MVVQDPEDAHHDETPLGAIHTGGVSAILPASHIAGALSDFFKHPGDDGGPPEHPVALSLPFREDVIELLRAQTAHDFGSYDPGALDRRLQHRMALTRIPVEETRQYLQILHDDKRELDRLVNDLLVDETPFFRDPLVLDGLARMAIPGLIQDHSGDRPLRMRVAGCRTGEDAYSLAILVLEQIASAGRTIRLQVFADDSDVRAITFARDGLYPNDIADHVGVERLARFFSQEATGWRATAELRSAIVFATQDVQQDSAFSRFDLISYRVQPNYLKPAIQEKLLSLFQSSLSKQGVLLLGSPWTFSVEPVEFVAISKASGIYRQAEHGSSSQQDNLARSANRLPGDSVRIRPIQMMSRATRSITLSELGRRAVIKAYAPASVLVNAANESLFVIGATDRYLRLPPGQSSSDLLTMVRPGLRLKLHLAMKTARQTMAKVVVLCQTRTSGVLIQFNLEVHPILDVEEGLLLVCFVEKPLHDTPIEQRSVGDRQAFELAELTASRTELQDRISDLELLTEEQTVINEEALLVNEEQESDHRELLSLNAQTDLLNQELLASNLSIKQELRTRAVVSDDLRNVLYSTGIAILVLDTHLAILFFTPATKSLFAVTSGDIGRPLSDLAALAPDSTLERDVHQVLQHRVPSERDIQTATGHWFRRCILPYRSEAGQVEGVVMTFTDITTSKILAAASGQATRRADIAHAARSHFLAAAFRELRQPMQILTLLQGLLARTVDDDSAQEWLTRLDATVDSMSRMLNSLLHVSGIEAGIETVALAPFPIDDLLIHLRDEFTHLARTKGLLLSVLPCGLQVVSDARLLQPMIRILLSNAIKHTKAGKVILGCRRQGPMLSVQIWDTGPGLSGPQMSVIADQDNQADVAVWNTGPGLGLANVRRFGDLLAHQVGVCSRGRRGSRVSIAIPIHDTGDLHEERPIPSIDAVEPTHHQPGSIIIVVDDHKLREPLARWLRGPGRFVAVAADSLIAFDLLARATPDLVILDCNTPFGPTGVRLAARIRQMIGSNVPVVILTSEFSPETSREVTCHGCLLLAKPIKQSELTETINRLLATAKPIVAKPVNSAATVGSPTIYVVEDDEHVRATIIEILKDDDRIVLEFSGSKSFLDAYNPGDRACLLIDADLPAMDGIELLSTLRAAGHRVPTVMITARGDIATAARAVRTGATDFIQRPIDRKELLASIRRAVNVPGEPSKSPALREAALNQLAALTSRQQQIMKLVLAGHPSKNIAADLGISQRTVENHRASVMRKTGATSLPALARLALAAQLTDAESILAPGTRDPEA